MIPVIHHLHVLVTRLRLGEEKKKEERRKKEETTG